MSKKLVAIVGGAAALVVAAPMAIVFTVGGALERQQSTCTIGSTAIVAGSIGSPKVSPVTGPIDLTLPLAVKTKTGGNIQLAAGLDYGSSIESGWSATAFGKGGWGYYQIQKGPPKDWHPDISFQQTQDANASTAYMLGAYTAALQYEQQQQPNEWITDPQTAANQVAFYAENPTVNYTVNRSQADRDEAWNVTVAAMIQLGQIKRVKDFGSAAAVGASKITAKNCSPQQLITAAGTANSQQLASYLLSQRHKLLDGEDWVFDVDLTAMSQGHKISPCGTPIVIDTRVLQLLVNILKNGWKIYIYTIATQHGCDGLEHPKGRAFDVDFATDPQTKLQTNFCSGPFTGGENCDPSGDNQEVDRKFLSLVAVLLQPGGGLGQMQCYGRTGTPMPTGISFFDDSCNHQHVQVAFN